MDTDGAGDHAARNADLRKNEMVTQPNPDSDFTMWKLHCEGAFKDLKDRLDTMDKRLWAIAGATVLELVGIVLLLVFGQR